jgi:hypothetical protein
MIEIRLAEAAGDSNRETLGADIFSERFLIKRPLLQALEKDIAGAPVLLIDELDRTDEPFEAYLLEVLSDFQITIPELGTIKAAEPPIVVVTSNRTREIHDALKRRCFYYWVDYPDAPRELEILRVKVPGAGEELSRQIVGFVQKLRKVELFKGDGTESVLLNRNGTNGLVKGTGDGTEQKPLVRIGDSAGHSLVVTETHAIVTGKGPKMAWQVRVGDTLYTREGTSRVKTIEQVPAVANQKVHNLFIGDPAQAAAGKTTMFANGILVGDMYMQNEVYKRSQIQGFSKDEVLARLPKEWQRDYLNSLANGTHRR